MANLVDKSGDASSNLVRGGTGTSLAFTMPGNVPLDVESVVGTIDNSAGAATTATLVVRDSSGEVVATKRMGETFPAGDTGTVTFSLRNADDAVTSSAGATATAVYGNFAVAIPAGGGFAAGIFPWALQSGTALLDLVTNGNTTPTIITSGVYAFSASAFPNDAAEPAGLRVVNLNFDCNATIASTTSNQTAALNSPGFTDVVGVSVTQFLEAGDTVDLFTFNNFTVAHSYGFTVVVQQLS